MAVLPATFTNCRRINDWHHFTDVFQQETIKECLVAILQGRQEHISLEISFFPPIVLVGASELLFNSGRMQWKQSQKAELTSLILGKRAALVEQRVIQEKLSSETSFDWSFALICDNRPHQCHAPFGAASLTILLLVAHQD